MHVVFRGMVGGEKKTGSELCVVSCSDELGQQKQWRNVVSQATCTTTDWAPHVREQLKSSYFYTSRKIHFAFKYFTSVRVFSALSKFRTINQRMVVLMFVQACYNDQHMITCGWCVHSCLMLSCVKCDCVITIMFILGVPLGGTPWSHALMQS